MILRSSTRFQEREGVQESTALQNSSLASSRIGIYGMQSAEKVPPRSQSYVPKAEAHMRPPNIGLSGRELALESGTRWATAHRAPGESRRPAAHPFVS